LIVYDFAVFHRFTRPAFKTEVIEKLTLKKALNKATRLAAISENTKKEMQELFDIPPSKIDIVYAGVDAPIKMTRKEAREIISRIGIKQKYILFVGTIEPRKNVKNLIHAYAALPRSIRQEYKLILVGKKGWRTNDIYQAAVGLGNQVKFMGYLTERELASLYKTTTLFVYPSLYEGFGLPVLEAMSYGAPVVTSNTTSLPEVAGDAAIIINPWHIKEITRAIKRVISNDTLREKLITRGLERIKNFTWKKCAQKTLDSINKAGVK
jgi:glycosyltransferase involved in cell wall biosynthesis